MSVQRIIILTNWLYTEDGSNLATGGTETYVQKLAGLLRDEGREVLILQRGAKSFQAEFEGIPVISWDSEQEKRRLIEEKSHERKTLWIYSDLFTFVPISLNPAILIQHGIYWDFLYRQYAVGISGHLMKLRQVWDVFSKALHCLRAIRAVEKVVTVDTNFQNWMRTMCTWESFEDKFVYIPNFTQILPEVEARAKLSRGGGIRTVLFARRFTECRGTFMWSKVVKTIAPSLKDIHFIFCGRGSGDDSEAKLIREMKDLNNVSIYERPFCEMPDEHRKADVEVVPSRGSEGTSLSLIEAMGAANAVICTTVGGLCNVAIPGYNALVVQARDEYMRKAFLDLVENPAKARAIAARAYETAEIAFSENAWKRRWIEVIADVEDRRFGRTH